MKKCFGYMTCLAVLAATAAFSGCGDSSSSPTDASGTSNSSQEEQSSNSVDGYSSAESYNPESSEQSFEERSSDSQPSSSEDTTPGENGTSSENTTTPESTTSSETTSSSSEVAATNSSASELQQYENAWPFFDEGWRDECLRLANEYRATEGVAPLVLADEDVQWCTVQQAAADLAENSPHGHSSMCGIGAQNSGPNFSTTWRKSATAVVQGFLKMMWDDEKALVTSGERDPEKSEDYSYIGHYLNMRNSAYTKLSCGIALSEDGTKGWFNMNFYW
jgi:hypothetical protein